MKTTRIHLFLKSSWEEKKHLLREFNERAYQAGILIVQHGPNLTTGEMYDTTQCSELFKDGDMFVCNSGKTVGFLSKAWPVALYGETGSLDLFRPEMRDSCIAQRPGLARAAKAMAGELAVATEETAKKVDKEDYY